jgi:hypothetical protein
MYSIDIHEKIILIGTKKEKRLRIIGREELYKKK